MLVHHRLEAVVGGHRGQRGVIGRGDGTVHGRRGAVVGQLQVHAVRGALVATTPSSTSKADWSALLERPVVSELCSAAMLLPCAATWPSVVARAAAVARGAIAGASALLSSFEASSAVALSSRDWMAAALLPDAAVLSSVRAWRARYRSLHVGVEFVTGHVFFSTCPTAGSASGLQFSK